MSNEFNIKNGFISKGDGLINGGLTTQTLTITSGATNGYVLTSDASGNATWGIASSGGGTFTGGTVSGGTTFIGGLSASSSTTDALIVTGSGSTSPLFSVRGSNGTLFSVTDNLIGSLFTVTNSSSQPILQVNDNNTILMGNYLAPSLNLTVTKSVSSGLTDIYAIPTSAYTAAFFDYSVNDGSNLRSGTVRSIWDGSTISWDDDTFSGIGSSSSLITFNMIITGGTAVLQSSGATSGWVVKTIIRSI